MNNILALLTLLESFLSKADEIRALLAKAHGEGRDVTDTEIDILTVGDDAARARLQSIIDTKKGESK